MFDLKETETTLNFEDINDILIKDDKYVDESHNSIHKSLTKSDNNEEMLDKKRFLDLKDKFENVPNGYISIIQQFCVLYNFLIPEFELVRENNVFRCTALFCNMKFVSSYEYDKIVAKNSACKRIVAYINDYWKNVFKHDTEQKNNYMMI